jgi:hypothetical protein
MKEVMLCTCGNDLYTTQVAKGGKTAVRASYRRAQLLAAAEWLWLISRYGFVLHITYLGSKGRSLPAGPDATAARTRDKTGACRLPWTTVIFRPTVYCVKQYETAHPMRDTNHIEAKDECALRDFAVAITRCCLETTVRHLQFLEDHAASASSERRHLSHRSCSSL